MDDLISRDAAIEILAAMQGRCNTKAALVQNSKIWQQIKDLPSAQPEPLTDKEQRIFLAAMEREEKICEEVDKIWQQIKDSPSAQPEPLTDKEQRIFLAAMEREEKICEEVDRKYVREPYEDSLMRVCREIRRKVKGALWS